MARTRMFSHIRKALRQASFVNKAGWSRSQIQDAAQDIAQSRREFLKVSALLAIPAATGAPLIPLFRGPTLSRGNPDPVLILGGGPAGLAAGYTLRKAGIPFRILEGSARVGGRVFTQQKFNSDDQFVELGGEYVDTDHKTLIQLATEVGLEIQDVGEDQIGDAEPEMFFFKGIFRNHGDLVAAAGPIARAVHAAKLEIGPQFNYRNATPAGVKWDHVTLAEFLDSLRGKAEDWIIDAVGVGYTLEMGRDPAEQSVLNLFWQIDDDVLDGFELFGSSDETKRVKGGNSALPMRLAELIGRDSDALHLSTRVLSLGRRGSKIMVTADKNGKTVEFTANQVICALPLSTLKDVEGLEAIGFSAPKLACIRNIRYGQNSKLIMDFETRGWREKIGGAKGSSGTVFSDLKSQSFWETSRAQKGDHGILTNFLGGTAGLNARRETIETVNLPDLAKIFPRLPEKFIGGVAMNWNQMPLIKGSYVCVGPGQYSQFFGAQMEPELNGKIVFAGEHTSVEFMGFMNGAYETGIHAAQAVMHARGRKLMSQLDTF